MVRNYVCKTTQASWSEASMKEAIRVVKNKWALEKLQGHMMYPKIL